MTETWCGREPARGAARFLAGTLLALKVSGSGGLALAQTGLPPVFVVAPQPVAGEATATETARDVAREQGEAAALRHLMERLTLPADWPHLPVLDAQTVGGSIVDYEVLEEHGTGARYSGVYLYRFNPKAVRQILRNAGINFSEVASRSVILVPVIAGETDQAGSPEEGAWRQAWTTPAARYGLIPWTVATTDQAPPAAFAGPAGQVPPEVVKALSDRLDGADVVVAALSQPASAVPGHREVAVSRYHVDGSVESDTVPVDGAPGPGLDRAAAAASLAALETRWKDQILTPTQASMGETWLWVSVPTADAADWGAVRRRLAHLGILKSMTVEFMTRAEVRLSLGFRVSGPALDRALAQQDLVLSTAGPMPTLRVASRATEAATP